MFFQEAAFRGLLLDIHNIPAREWYCRTQVRE
jgi:hypothetical protein